MKTKYVLRKRKYRDRVKKKPTIKKAGYKVPDLSEFTMEEQEIILACNTP